MVFEKSICECSWRPRMNICFFHRRFTIISTKCLHSNISAPKNQQGLSLEFSRPHKGCKIPLHIPTRVARILPFDFPPRHLWVFTYIGGFPSRSPRHGAGSRVDPPPWAGPELWFLTPWTRRMSTLKPQIGHTRKWPQGTSPCSCDLLLAYPVFPFEPPVVFSAVLYLKELLKYFVWRGYLLLGGGSV